MAKLSPDSIDNIIRKGNEDHISHLIKHHDLDDQHLRAITNISSNLHRHGNEIIDRGMDLNSFSAEQMIYASKSLAERVLKHPSIQHHYLNLKGVYNNRLKMCKQYPSPKNDRWLNT